MNKQLRLLTGVILLFTTLSVAFARPPSPNPNPCQNTNRPPQCQTGPRAVPEIDAQTTPMALAILVGGLLLVAERSRRSQKRDLSA